MPDVLVTVLAQPGLIWIALAMSVAGLVRGFSGFGSAMIIVPVTSAFTSPVAAITILILSDLLGVIPSAPGAWRDIDRGDLMRLLVGALISMPIGVWFLTSLDGDIFRWLVSVTVVLLLIAIIMGWRYRGRLTPPLVFGSGSVGGLMSGAFGIAGPPVIMLYMASTLPAKVVRATLMLYLVGIDILMIGYFASLGLLESVAVLTGLLMTVPYMTFNRIGAQLFRVGSEAQFRWVAYVIIAISAVVGLPVWS
ncbi:MAG: sulfite exporter TauE/SafE family protein [Arenibacterium sp.]